MQHTSNLWSNNCVPINLTASAGGYNNLDRNGMNYEGPVPPVSTAMYGTTSTFSWAHTVPSLMPWMPKGEPEVPETIVHFTAPFPPDPCTSQTATSWELLNNFGANKSNINLHLKRKSDLEVMEAAPQKLCITEERMAARFKEMHITNQFSLPAENTPFGPYGNINDCPPLDKPITNLKDLDFMLQSSNGENLTPTKSLILAPEIKKLVQPEKLFASTFLSEVERPTMAVVLWQPQNNALLRTNENTTGNKNQEEEDARGNSNTFLLQQNTSVCSSGLSPNLHPNDPKLPQPSFDEEMLD